MPQKIICIVETRIPMATTVSPDIRAMMAASA
jgi:hypothetical protein